MLAQSHEDTGVHSSMNQRASTRPKWVDSSNGQSIAGHFVLMVDLKVTKLLFEHLQPREDNVLRLQRARGLGGEKVCSHTHTHTHTQRKMFSGFREPEDWGERRQRMSQTTRQATL